MRNLPSSSPRHLPRLLIQPLMLLLLPLLPPLLPQKPHSVHWCLRSLRETLLRQPTPLRLRQPLWPR